MFSSSASRKIFLFFLFLYPLPASAAAAPAAAAPVAVDEIVVSAPPPPPPHRLNSAITTLSSEELASRGQIFLMDALRFVSGITITQEGGAGATSAVRIRGAESKHTKVFMDGVEVNNTSSGAFDFGGLLASNIEQVEIIRGGQSLAFGAGAVGGVIYITTKSKGGADFFLSGGSFNTFSVGGNVGGANKHGVYVNLGGTLYRTRGHDISASGENEADGYFSGSINSKLGVNKTFGRHRLRGQINHRYQQDALNADFCFHPVTFASIPDCDSPQRNQRNETGIDFEYSTHLPSAVRLNVHLQGAHLETELDSNQDITKEERTQGEMKTGLSYAHRLFALNGTLLGGWEIEKYFRPLNNPNGGANFHEVKRYVALEASVRAFRADVTAGVRYHHYRASRNRILWQVGAGYQPHGQEVLRLRGSYGTSIQEPSQLELYGFFPTSFTPNPHLRPELTTSVEGGMDLDFSRLLKTNIVKELSFSATGFALFIEDEISGFTTPINAAGISKRRGVESALAITLVQLGFIDSLTMRATYTFTRAHGATGALSLNRPKHVANFTMRTKVKQFSFDWDASWQSSQQAYNGRISSYPLVNVQLGFAVNDKLSFFVRGENITNEKTATTRDYQRRGAGVYLGVKGSL